jgi:serine/threonine protein kinase
VSYPRIVSDELTSTGSETAGRQIGRYRLTCEIASGGQASIFMAVADGPQGFGKIVALKRMHRHLAGDASNVSMFLDEARLAAQLTHPNICGVIDFGIDEGDYFMVMEYLTGVTVAKLAVNAVRQAAQGTLDRKKWAGIVAYIVAQAAEGLRAAHELKDARGEKLNVVHRDVSPQNLMVGFDGSVRVMDFGIAKYDERDTETSLGEVKGKYAYMSPEQARAGQVDHRTDIWALGVIAWELLTLRRLFKRDSTANTVIAVVYDPVEPPSSIEPTLSSEVDEVILAALSRNLTERTDDPRTFGNHLRKAVNAQIGASELAAWVQAAFPAAEAEARTMIDLARQAPRMVPSIAKREADASTGNSLELPIHALLEQADQERASLVSPAPTSPRAKSKRTPIALGFAIATLGAIGLGLIGAQLQPSPEPVWTEAAPQAQGVDHAPAPQAQRALPQAPLADPQAQLADPQALSSVPEAQLPDPQAQALEVVAPVAAVRSAMGARAHPRNLATETPVQAVAAAPPATPPTPAAPEPTHATTENAPGTLVLVTPGTWANVYGPNGELWGATPLRRSMPPGPVTVELRFEGQPPGRRVSAEVTAGGTARVVERM